MHPTLQAMLMQGGGSLPAYSGAAVSKTYLGSVAIDSGAPASMVTASGFNLGSASSSRRVVVFIAGVYISTPSASSVTIAGIAATKLASMGSGNNVADIWGATVPTGTAGDVVVTFPGNTFGALISGWALYNTKQLAPFATASGGSSLGLDVSIPPGGGAIYGAYAATSGASVTGFDADAAVVATGNLAGTYSYAGSLLNDRGVAQTKHAGIGTVAAADAIASWEPLDPATYGTWTMTVSGVYDSGYTGHLGARAPGLNDGLTGAANTLWGSPSSPATQWIMADFGQVEHVNQVSLQPATGIDGWNSGYLTGRKLQYSLDGSTWFDVQTLSFSNNTKQNIATNFDAQYVRVLGTSGWMALGEFHFLLSPV